LYEFEYLHNEYPINMCTSTEEIFIW